MMMQFEAAVYRRCIQKGNWRPPSIGSVPCCQGLKSIPPGVVVGNEKNRPDCRLSGSTKLQSHKLGSLIEIWDAGSEGFEEEPETSELYIPITSMMRSLKREESPLESHFCRSGSENFCQKRQDGLIHRLRPGSANCLN